jgi:hypothetical protein
LLTVKIRAFNPLGAVPALYSEGQPHAYIRFARRTLRSAHQRLACANRNNRAGKYFFYLLGILKRISRLDKHVKAHIDQIETSISWT